MTPSKTIPFFALVIAISWNIVSRAQGLIHHVGLSDPMSIFEHQPSATTCWAACDAMLLKSQGVRASAKDIIIKKFDFFNPAIDQSAGAELSMPAAQLDGAWTNKSDKTIQIDTTVSPGEAGYISENDVRTLIDSLSSKKPAVIATSQHGRVCVAVNYIDGPLGPRLISMTFLNPNFPPQNALNTVSMDVIAAQFQAEGSYLGMITFDVSVESESDN
jgi:hypothetical protein